MAQAPHRPVAPSRGNPPEPRKQEPSQANAVQSPKGPQPPPREPVVKNEVPMGPSTDDNPKIVAPAGTVPTAAAAEGPSPPHPASDKPDITRDTPAMAAARGRIAEQQLPPDRRVEGPVPFTSGPIQCIAKKKFYDKRNALIQPGATYNFFLEDGEDFPYDLLEPVDEGMAEKLRKEQGDQARRRPRR